MNFNENVGEIEVVAAKRCFSARRWPGSRKSRSDSISYPGHKPTHCYMPLFCDVALAVPLDMAFTYAIPPGHGAGGGRTRARAIPAATHVGHRR